MQWSDALEPWWLVITELSSPRCSQPALLVSGVTGDACTCAIYSSVWFRLSPTSQPLVQSLFPTDLAGPLGQGHYGTVTGVGARALSFCLIGGVGDKFLRAGVLDRGLQYPGHCVYSIPGRLLGPS